MKKTSIYRFWTWFIEAGQTFRRSYRDQEEVSNFIREIEQQLGSCCGRGLGIGLSFEDGEQPLCTLLFTAHGKERHFYKIKEIMLAAPMMQGWSFIELLPPVKIDDSIRQHFDGVDLDPFDCWFDSSMAIDFRGRYVVAVYTMPPVEFSDAFKRAVMTIIFNLLGERVFGEKLGFVHIGDLLTLDAQARAMLVNLQELPDYFELPYAHSMAISGDGKLMAIQARYKPK